MIHDWYPQHWCILSNTRSYKNAPPSVTPLLNLIESPTETSLERTDKKNPRDINNTNDKNNDCNNKKHTTPKKKNLKTNVLG